MRDYGLGPFNAFLLAILVYMALICLIFFQLNEYQKEAVEYTDTENTFVDVEIGEFKPRNINQIQQEQETQTQALDEGKETTNKEVKTEKVEQKASDISSLFGNVKDFQEQKTAKVQSSAKSSAGAKSQTAANLFNSVGDNLMPDNEKPSGEGSEKQMKGVYDEFLGKIRRIIEERWKLYQTLGQFKVLLHFSINAKGEFSYTSVSKSYDEAFDAKVLEFLTNLKGKFIAYPPDNKTFKGMINLEDNPENMETKMGE